MEQPDGDKWQLTWEYIEVMCLVALLDRYSQNTSCVGGEQRRQRTLGYSQRKSQHKAFVGDKFQRLRQQPFIRITFYECYLFTLF